MGNGEYLGTHKVPKKKRQHERQDVREVMKLAPPSDQIKQAVANRLGRFRGSSRAREKSDSTSSTTKLQLGAKPYPVTQEAVGRTAKTLKAGDHGVSGGKTW
jgi:hypothetical protein